MKKPKGYLTVEIHGNGQIMKCTIKKAELNEAIEMGRKMWKVVKEPKFISVKNEMGEKKYFKKG